MQKSLWPGRPAGRRAVGPREAHLERGALPVMRRRRDRREAARTTTPTLAPLSSRYLTVGSEARMRVWMRDAVVGLEHLHSYNILHRDIKADNVMLRTAPGDQERLVLIDFGLCAEVQRVDSAAMTRAIVNLMRGDVEGAEERIFI